MAIKPRYLQGQPKRQTVLLDDSRALSLAYIAPGNLSEAVRYCISYALEHGALDAAQFKHTPAQRAAVAKMRARAATIDPGTGLPPPELYAPPKLPGVANPNLPKPMTPEEAADAFYSECPTCGGNSWDCPCEIPAQRATPVQLATVAPTPAQVAAPAAKPGSLRLYTDAELRQMQAEDEARARILAGH